MVNESYSEYRFGGLNNADPMGQGGTTRAGNRQGGASNINKVRQERAAKIILKKKSFVLDHFGRVRHPKS